MAKGYREVRGRLGVFGLFWRILFWAFQILMLLFAVTLIVSGTHAPGADAEDGAVLGWAIFQAWGWMTLLGTWAIGSVILGIPVLITRRTSAMVPIED